MVDGSTISMNAEEYHFVTIWRVPGTVEDVAAVISDIETLPEWWPSVYLDVEELVAGDEDGIGKEVELTTTGWLPYILHWQFRVDESDYPYRFTLDARGDFVGRGEWTLRQTGEQVVVRYEWSIRSEKPLLRYGSILFHPIFAANHRWAMARGEESLRLELERRALQEGERDRLPSPPGPVDRQRILCMTIFVLFWMGMVGSILIYLVRRRFKAG